MVVGEGGVDGDVQEEPPGGWKCSVLIERSTLGLPRAGACPVPPKPGRDPGLASASVSPQSHPDLGLSRD